MFLIEGTHLTVLVVSSLQHHLYLYKFPRTHYSLNSPPKLVWELLSLQKAQHGNMVGAWGMKGNTGASSAYFKPDPSSLLAVAATTLHLKVENTNMEAWCSHTLSWKRIRNQSLSCFKGFSSIFFVNTYNQDSF